MKIMTTGCKMLATVVMIMVILGLAACSSTKHVGGTDAPKAKAASPAASYAKKVLTNTPEVKACETAASSLAKALSSGATKLLNVRPLIP